MTATRALVASSFTRAAERLTPPVAALLLIATVHLALLAFSGVVASPDEVTYSAWAERLIALRMNVGAFAAENDFALPRITHIGWVILIAVMKLIAGEHFREVVAVLNALFFAGTGALLMSAARRLTSDPLARLALLALHIAGFETFQWIRYVLADTLFLLLCTAVAWSVIAAATEKSARRYWIAAVVLVAVASFVRPTGLFLVPAVAAGFFLVENGHRGRFRENVRLLALLGIGGIAIMLLFAWLARSPESWPIDFGRRQFRTLASFVAKGQIIHDRPYTWHRPPSSYGDAAMVVGDRTIHFYQFVTRGFSLAHNALSAAYFVPLYSLAMFGAIAASRARSRVTALAHFFTVVIAVFPLFHALTIIDFDWRYRTPVMPYLLLLAALGIDAIRHFSLRKTSWTL